MCLKNQGSSSWLATWGTKLQRAVGVDGTGPGSPSRGVWTFPGSQRGATDGFRAEQKQDLDLCILKMNSAVVEGEGLGQGETERDN